MTDIFISYAREDRKSAERLSRYLTDSGWSVWWDREIEAGDDFSDVIESALTNARAVVVLWSRHSIASNWVSNEAAEGEERHILVPVLLDEDIEQPLRFRHLQSVNLANWSGDPSNHEYLELQRALESKIRRGPCGTQPMASPISQATSEAPTWQPSLEPAVYNARFPSQAVAKSRVTPLVVLVGAGVLASVVGGAIIFHGPREPIAEPRVSASTVSSGHNEPRVDDKANADKPTVQLWADSFDQSSERVNSQERHPASAAFDGNRQSAWNSKSSTVGKPEWIEAKFAEPVYVHHVVVYNGYQFLDTRGESLFFKNLRAKTLDVFADHETTPVAKAEFGKMDQTPVSIFVRHQAQSLRFSVRETWPADNSAIGRFGDVCISEIEIWGNSGR
jgi:hypothetical protein